MLCENPCGSGWKFCVSEFGGFFLDSGEASFMCSFSCSIGSSGSDINGIASTCFRSHCIIYDTCMYMGGDSLHRCSLNIADADTAGAAAACRSSKSISNSQTKSTADLRDVCEFIGSSCQHTQQLLQPSRQR